MRLKSGRITPIYTLCVYHGEEPWDVAKEINVTVEEFAEKMRKAGYL